MFNEESAEFITESYSLLFSEQVMQSTFAYLSRNKFNNYNLYTQFIYTFLNRSSINFIDIANKNYLSYDEQVRLDISEKKSKPSYWIKEYEGFIKLKNSMGKNPDGAYINGFYIPDEYFQKVKYDNRISEIVKL